jgi:hypothetical protein
MAGPAEPYAELIALYGRPGAKAVLQTGRRNHERVRTLIEELGSTATTARAAACGSHAPTRRPRTSALR